MNAVFLKEMKDVDVKKKTKAPRDFKKDIISEDEDCNMTNSESSKEEDPINTTLAYCVKAEVKEISGDDFNYQEEDDSDENEEMIKKSRKPKLRKYRTRKTKSTKKTSDKDFWESLSKRKKVKKPKKFTCNSICKQNCNTKIDKQWRHDLCAEFWSLNRAERLNYISKIVDKKPVLLVRRNRSSGYSNVYFLKNRDGEKVRVCVGFFFSTLSVSRHLVTKAVEKKTCGGNDETLDCSQVEKSKTEDDPITEDHKDLISAQSTSAKGTIENIDVQKDVKTDITATKEIQLPQQPCPPKPARSSIKRKSLKKEHRPQPVNCDETCQMKCTRHFSEEQRAQICATYWSMDYKRKKDFLLSRVETRDIIASRNDEYRKTKRAKRSFSNRFYFRSGRQNVRVCLKFFESTLCIGRRTIDNAIRNADPNTGSYAGEDKRGRRAAANRIPEDMVLGAMRHIESYPTWVPHKKYKTRFLHSSLNIERMYREYKQACIDQQRKFVNSAYFRKIFHKDYHLAFLKPNSKHAHKVSSSRKIEKDSEAVNLKKINPNISEFTGEEGGFWMPAESNVARLDQIENEQKSQPRLEYPQMSVEACEVNRINIQQNLQLQAPQCVQQTPFLNVLNATQCSASTDYLQHHVGKPESQQTDFHNVMPTYTHSAYTQDSNVFRIL